MFFFPLAAMIFPLTNWPVQASQVLNDAIVTRPFRHTVWESTLMRYATASGAIDFIALRMHPGRLNQYLEQLALISPENHPDYFPHPMDVLTYWLNAYNALALKIALNHYPLPSPSLKRDDETPSVYSLGARTYSLRALRERLMLRYYAFYPHLLFALTNYTQDAPPVLPQAYDSDALSRQLLAVTNLSLREGRIIRFRRISGSCPVIELSPYWKIYEDLWGDSQPETSKRVADSAWTRVWPIPATKTNQDPNAWAIRFKPFAPPDFFSSRWKRPCVPMIRYRLPYLRWRQVNPV